jgi:hypothetical protein
MYFLGSMSECITISTSCSGYPVTVRFGSAKIDDLEPKRHGQMPGWSPTWRDSKFYADVGAEAAGDLILTFQPSYQWEMVTFGSSYQPDFTCCRLA